MREIAIEILEVGRTCTVGRTFSFGQGCCAHNIIGIESRVDLDSSRELNRAGANQWLRASRAHANWDGRYWFTGCLRLVPLLISTISLLEKDVMRTKGRNLSRI